MRVSGVEAAKVWLRAHSRMRKQFCTILSYAARRIVKPCGTCAACETRLSRCGPMGVTRIANVSLPTFANSLPVQIWARLGGNDEEEATKQIEAREPKVQPGAAKGQRGDKGARPLIRIDELAPGLRADEIIGTEVRSSDDKIVGEVRNIVFGTKDRKDYAIVASGGFFTPGKESIVVPIQALKVSQERSSFFLPMTKDAMKAVPLMPDQRLQVVVGPKVEDEERRYFFAAVSPVAP